MDIHASTQMTITGYRGAAFMEGQGISRVVPARELSLEEVRMIKEKTGLEIECFVHGALCYCYSGQCLLSSMIGGRSGNRGQCAQPCRLPYTIEGEKKYYLSPKACLGILRRAKNKGRKLPDNLRIALEQKVAEGGGGSGN